jgi:hypothetical protein
MRNLFIAFSLLLIGTPLWPASALALECDPAISGGPCNGSGQKYRLFERSAFRDPVSSTRMLVNEPIERDDYAGARSVRLERTTNPTRARYTSFGISLAMGDELSYRPGRLNIDRAAGQLLSSRTGLQMSRADAVLADDYSANRAVQYRQPRLQPGVDVKNDGGDKVSLASSSMNPAPQPGSGALLIAGLLGICAVARRRISSILG